MIKNLVRTGADYFLAFVLVFCIIATLIAVFRAKEFQMANETPIATDYSGVREYIGARYVPVFANPLEWSDTRGYEPLTIVSHQGNSYTSMQSVPPGIDITDTDYWASTGNYNAQVEAYRKEVASWGVKIDQANEGSTSAVSKADSAISTANAAKAKADSALTLADMANDTVDEINQLVQKEKPLYFSMNDCTNLASFISSSSVIRIAYWPSTGVWMMFMNIIMAGTPSSGTQNLFTLPAPIASLYNSTNTTTAPNGIRRWKTGSSTNLATQYPGDLQINSGGVVRCNTLLTGEGSVYADRIWGECIYHIAGANAA